MPFLPNGTADTTNTGDDIETGNQDHNNNFMMQGPLYSINDSSQIEQEQEEYTFLTRSVEGPIQTQPSFPPHSFRTRDAATPTRRRLPQGVEPYEYQYPGPVRDFLQFQEERQPFTPSDLENQPQIYHSRRDMERDDQGPNTSHYPSPAGRRQEIYVDAVDPLPPLPRNYAVETRFDEPTFHLNRISTSIPNPLIGETLFPTNTSFRRLPKHQDKERPKRQNKLVKVKANTATRPWTPIPSSKLASFVPGFNRDSVDTAFHDTTIRYTADAALNHARINEHLISDAFARSKLDGLYYIQVGFNEDLITRGQGVLEEIYIYIGSEVQNDQVAEVPSVLVRLSQILFPFPGVLYTPENIYHISPHLQREDLSESEFWSVLKTTGVFREGLQLAKSPIDTGGVQAGLTSNNTSGSHPQGQSSGANEKGKGRDEFGENSEGGDHRDDNHHGGGNGSDKEGDDDGGGGDSDDEGDGDPPSGPVGSKGDRGPKILSIPFHSKLIIKDEKEKARSLFTISATVNMKLAENTSGTRRTKESSVNSSSHPDSWLGPWFSVQIPYIQANSNNTVPDDARYGINTHNVEDPVKAKSERNYTGGGWATLSGTPNLKIGGSASQKSGQETSQNRWRVLVSPSSDSRKKKSITWNYDLNKKYYDQQPTTTFQPGPSIDFGYELYARRPHIEVDITLLWSENPDNSKFRLQHWFSFKSRESPQLPSVFTNFLHQVSVSVDLNNLGADSWVVGLDTDLPDEENLPHFQRSRRFEPISANASNRKGQSKCEVTLQRALHGCIKLNKNDKSGISLLSSLLANNVGAISSEETTLPPILPTPPRSPFHVAEK